MKSIRSILHILLGVTLICSCNEATELAHITPNVSLIKYKDIVKIDSLYTYPGDSLYQNWINQYNKNLEDKTSRSLSPEDDAFFNKQYIVKSTEATVLYGKTGNLRQKERLSISKIQRPILSAPTIRTTRWEASSQPRPMPRRSRTSLPSTSSLLQEPRETKTTR